jgi:uncharacterized integral membrane protein
MSLAEAAKGQWVLILVAFTVDIALLVAFLVVLNSGDEAGSLLQIPVARGVGLGFLAALVIGAIALNVTAFVLVRRDAKYYS